MTLYGFGTATIDIRITTADLGEDYRAKLLAKERKLFGGGAVANALCQASRLGSETQWLGLLGCDHLGDLILRDLASCGIGTDRVVRRSEALSPFNLAVYAGDDGRRVGGYLLPNCLAEIGDAELEAFTSAPVPGDWCLVEIGEIPLPIVAAFCSRLRRRGIPVVLDVDLDPVTQCKDGSRDGFSELLEYASVVMPNSQALGSVYGDIDAREMTRAVYDECGRVVVTTAGENGAFYTEDGISIEWCPAPAVDVIDTVGAGDAFHGGFIHAYMHGATLEDAVWIGSLCGAANCRRFGAREGMPDRDELDALRAGSRNTGRF